MDIKQLRLDHRKLRAARGALSQASVAREIGVSRQHLWNYEAGHACPPAHILARLCALYRIDISDLTSTTA